MWPLKSIISEKQSMFCGFQHIFIGIPRKIGGKMFILWGSLGMWHSNQLSWINEPCSEVSTHINGGFKEIDGKTFILRVNLGMWPFKSMFSGNWGLFWRFQTHIYGVPKGIDGKMFIFLGNLVMSPLKLIISEKMSPVLMVSTHIYGVSKEMRWENY